MFNLIKRSLSGDSRKSESSEVNDEELQSQRVDESLDSKTPSKRNRSGDDMISADELQSKSQKRKRLTRKKCPMDLKLTIQRSVRIWV